MAALALGAVGGYFFGPIGFLIGSALGNWLDPPKGPQLNDLKLQTSQYGDMIPLLYGQARLAGEVIWQTDLMPNQQGGKGGPIYYTYSASWAVKICKGPVGGLLRIWADSTIIWDVTAGSTVNNSAIPLTFYRGVETAGPDPTMQGVLGAGNVPAFRDDCVAVFDNMDLSNYGNRLPTLSFEVYNASGPIPWRVATWTPSVDPTTTGPVMCTTYTGHDDHDSVLQLGRFDLQRIRLRAGRYTHQLVERSDRADRKHRATEHFELPPVRQLAINVRMGADRRHLYRCMVRRGRYLAGRHYLLFPRRTP